MLFSLEKCCMDGKNCLVKELARWYTFAYCSLDGTGAQLSIIAAIGGNYECRMVILTGIDGIILIMFVASQKVLRVLVFM